MSDLRERFLIVAVKWSTIKVETMNDLFSAALDWLKISNNTWIIWTNSNAASWLPYIKARLDSDDSVLIAELDLTTVDENYTGWYEKMVWDWINKHR